jgi:ribosomal protein S18 acetylase RimI-like enzyme
MVITTRIAVEGDKTFLWRLRVAAMREHVERVYGWDESVAYDHFERGFDPQALRIIQVDGQDAGVYRLRENVDFWFLGNIEILPEFQGHGVGGSVLQGLIDGLAGGNKALRLQVLRGNRALRLYERLGFVKIAETETHIHMERPVNEVGGT